MKDSTQMLQEHDDLHRTLLVVDDEPNYRIVLSELLSDEGYTVFTADNAEQAIKVVKDSDLDLVLTDMRMPGKDGIEICQRLRKQSNYTPILMLTAKSSELDRVLGLEIGADDYLTKPFSIRELIARVKAILRRVDAMSTPADSGHAEILHFGELEIDSDRRKVSLAGKEVILTAKEFDLLWYFAKNPGRVFSRLQLLDTVWGYGHDGYEHTVNSHINRLRAKIEQDPSQPQYVLTVWGVGYKFAEQAKNRAAG